MSVITHVPYHGHCMATRKIKDSIQTLYKRKNDDDKFPAMMKTRPSNRFHDSRQQIALVVSFLHFAHALTLP
jgi:hypothetical protein